jgi:hypothetical protein
MPIMLRRYRTIIAYRTSTDDDQPRIITCRSALGAMIPTIPPDTAISGAVRALLQRNWPTEVLVSDPRFLWFTQKWSPRLLRAAIVPPNTFADLIWLLAHEAASNASFDPNLEQAIEHVTEYGEYLAGLALEEELASILITVLRSPGLSVLLDRFGWSGQTPLSDEEAAAKDSITPQEMSALEAEMIRRLNAAGHVWAPALDRVLAALANSSLDQLLAERQLPIATTFTFQALRSASEALGRSWPLSEGSREAQVCTGEPASTRSTSGERQAFLGDDSEGTLTDVGEVHADRSVGAQTDVVSHDREILLVAALPFLPHASKRTLDRIVAETDLGASGEELLKLAVGSVRRSALRRVGFAVAGAVLDDPSLSAARIPLELLICL